MAALEAVGQIDIDPPLVEEERDAFALLTRPSTSPPPGRPAAACGWTVCATGCCLRLVAADALDDATGWLRYAVDVLTEQGAHRLRGLVAARRPRDGEMFTVRVTAQRRVHGRVLREGSPPRDGLAGVIDLDERRRRH